MKDAIVVVMIHGNYPPTCPGPPPPPTGCAAFLGRAVAKTRIPGVRQVPAPAADSLRARLNH